MHYINNRPITVSKVEKSKTVLIELFPTGEMPLFLRKLVLSNLYVTPNTMCIYSTNWVWMKSVFYPIKLSIYKTTGYFFLMYPPVLFVA